jgi:hypothetical protein
MFQYCSKEFLETAAQIFEILTPILIFFWFLISRKSKLKTEYSNEFIGSYGGFVNNTVNSDTTQIRYDGGIIMEIIQIDSNGYFKGEFIYSEDKIILGKVGGPPAIRQRALTSINFAIGKLEYTWNYKFWKKRNPILWKTNRIYNGELHIIERFDKLITDEKEILQRTYSMLYHRESGVIVFSEINANTNHQKLLPDSFTLLKKTNTLLDPYTNVKMIFQNPYSR